MDRFSSAVLKILEAIPRLLFGLVFLIFIAIAIGLLGSELRSFWNSIQSWGWTETQGKIEEAFVYYKSRRQSPTHGYTYQVRYSYLVNGQQFTGTRLCFSSETVTFESKEEAERRIAAYTPVGKTVAVFYDSKAPQEATLEKKHSWTGFKIFCGGGLVFIIACLIMAWRHSGKEEQKSKEHG